MASNTASGLIQAPGRQTPPGAVPEVPVPSAPAPAPSASVPPAPVPPATVPGMRTPETQTFRGQVPSTQVTGTQVTGTQVTGSRMSAPQTPGLAHAPTAAAQLADKPAVPAHMLPHRTPSQLLAIARQGLIEAAQTRPDGLRYATAHLAALRAAAAVLAARARPATHTRRSRVTSAWSLLVLVAPEFSEWAGYFALGAGKRAAAEAGIPRVVTPREADDLLRAAEQFVAVVESALGISYQPPLAA
jgi:hypothetical protein